MPESDAEIVAQRDEQDDAERDDWTPPIDEPEDGTDEEAE